MRVKTLQYGVAPEQETPHAPQLNGSVARSTQKPPHAVVAPAQRHVPPKHPSAPLHVLPHAPQLLRSADGSMQRPPQSIRPPGHAHTPPLQAWSARQTFPHAPQLLRSLAVDTQDEPHRVNGAAQPETHVRVNTLQNGVAPEQVIPHPPQLFGSVEVSTQALPHCVCASEQPQAVPLHVVPAGQTLPHIPQLLRSLWTHAPPQSIRLGGHAHRPLVHA